MFDQASSKPVPYSDTVYTDELFARYKPRFADREPIDLIFDLGAWLTGLNGFLNIYDRSISEADRTNATTRDRHPEFYLTHDALIRVSDLLRQVRQLDQANVKSLLGASGKEIGDCSAVLQDCSVLNAALIKSSNLSYAEWKAWRQLLSGKISKLALYDRLDATMSATGTRFLPEDLQQLISSNDLPLFEKTAASSVAARLSRILRSLQIVRGMLTNDEPLKPSILIFSGVYEETRLLIEHVNNSLSRFHDEETEIFALLDGTSYMATLELKKAYFEELAGLVALRPAPTTYARVEAAYGMLHDSMQQILTSFARFVDPEVESTEVFPEFRKKLAESLLLRDHLVTVMNTIQAAEQKPDKARMDALNKELNDFLQEPIKFLFYKDRESFERFCEEIPAADGNKDLVPILHRFAAYVETLLRQVNLRSVLNNYPLHG
ncbi:MAG: hypothetical protein QUS14_07560 [Pyrinomonadaceae bacterium]|nr:hypothetical protein [Pyrinomonadaceae bacterium]